MVQLPAGTNYQPTHYYSWMGEEPQSHAAGCSYDNLLVLADQQPPSSGVGAVTQQPPASSPLQHHPAVARKPSRSEPQEDAELPLLPALAPASLPSEAQPALQHQQPVAAVPRDCEGYRGTHYYDLVHLHQEEEKEDTEAPHRMAALY